MKTYLRLIKLAPSLPKYITLIFAFSLLGSLLSVANFSLVIPMLDVLFGTSNVNELPSSQPAFEWSAAFFTDFFKYYLRQAIESGGRLTALKFLAGTLIPLTIIRVFAKYASTIVSEKARLKLAHNIRLLYYNKVLHLHIGFFSNERRGDISSRMVNDVLQIETNTTNILTSLLREAVMVIAYFYAMFVISSQLTLFSLVVIPLSGLLISLLVKKLKETSNRLQMALSDINSSINETLEGIRVIQVFQAQAQMAHKFSVAALNYAKTFLKLRYRAELAPVFSEILSVGVVAGVLLYGGSLILAGDSPLKASEFIAFLIIFSQILNPAKTISKAFSDAQRLQVSAQRVFEIIDTKPQIVSKPNALPFASFGQQINISNLSFGYDADRPVLKNINLTIPKGQTVAFVGPSGSGKSTLLGLVFRFFDPQTGQISFDNKNVTDISLDELRNKMGIVTQETILFNDTIFNNIAFGRPHATQAEVEQAARVANAHDFIAELPAGYATSVGDSGMKLSGGQRQRLSIARAVLKNPEILLLDEATSALDTESEKLVQEALTNLMQNRTSLVVAHRLSTVQHADKIVVMQAGQLVEQGNHNQLMEQQGLYYRLIKMQTFEGEANNP